MHGKFPGEIDFPGAVAIEPPAVIVRANSAETARSDRVSPFGVRLPEDIFEC
jgi:hypothetical protein